MTPLTNLAITYLSGETYCRNPMVMVYANTLRDVFGDGKRVIITSEMGRNELDTFSRMGYEIFVYPTPTRANVFTYRWKCLNDYLTLYGHKHDHVIFTDSKDVLWQYNPISHIESWGLDRYNVILCNEGLSHFECEWNSTEQDRLREIARVDHYDFDHWSVVNGGVVLGKSNHVRDFAFLMYMMTAVGNAPTTDQCYINFLYHHPRYKDLGKSYFLADPNKIPYAVTGNTIKNHVARGSTAYRWENGKLVNRDNVPWSLFHQWDRTEYRGEILTNHGIPRID
jgi:hypothetical protein